MPEDKQNRPGFTAVDHDPIGILSPMSRTLSSGLETAISLSGETRSDLHPDGLKRAHAVECCDEE